MADTIKLPPIDGLQLAGSDIPINVQLGRIQREAARAALEAAAKVCDSAAIDATSEKRMKFLTVQGQAVYEGMYGGAINCAGGIRALRIEGETP